MRAEMTTYLKSVKRPIEIHREIRGINELPHWNRVSYIFIVRGHSHFEEIFTNAKLSAFLALFLWYNHLL